MEITNPLVESERIVSFDDGTGPAIYVSYPSIPVFDVTRWDGHQWVHLGTKGLSSSQAGALGGAGLMTLDDGSGLHLYAIATDALAKWEGQAGRWTNVPAIGLANGDGNMPLGSFDLGSGPRIYGRYQSRAPAWWNGTQWVSFGQADNTIAGYAMLTEPSGPTLYAFGRFNHIDGLLAHGFAKWDGQHWSSPTPDYWVGIQDLDYYVVFDDGHGPAIYTNAVLLQPGGATCDLSKWDGQRWTCLGNMMLQPGFVGRVLVVQAFDDGRGPALYIGGGFDGFAGHISKNLIRFDGTNWEPVPLVNFPVFYSGITRDARGLSLFMSYSGNISVGAGTTHRSVLLTGCIDQCYADCDRDERLSVNDFICFLNKFAIRDPYSNCTVDATINVADFTCFLNKFAAGCP